MQVDLKLKSKLYKKLNGKLDSQLLTIGHYLECSEDQFATVVLTLKAFKKNKKIKDLNKDLLQINYSKQSTDSMHSLLNYQWNFSQN